MNTVIYLVRHGKTDKTKLVASGDEITGNKDVDLDDSFIPEIKAFSEKMKFYNISCVYSSNYIRAKKTAQILSNNKSINIDKRLGERIGGTPNLDITPEEYYKMQFDDSNFSFPGGESANEVCSRMDEAISDILSNNSGKEILVVSHGAAITFYLKKWCNVSLTNVPKKIRKFEYNGNLIHEGVVNFIQCFKLTFDNSKNLVNIECF